MGVIKMATLKKAVLLAATHSRLCNQLSRRQISCSPVLLGNYWNKDWKPAGIPQTPEERAAAAKKYGIRPEDYKVLAEDSDDFYGRKIEHHLGDYPNLPIVAHSIRDPWEDYDHPQERRNYGELLHHDSEMPGNDWVDPNKPLPGRYSANTIFFRFFSIFFGLWFLWYVMEPFPLHPPMMPKQYPFNDLHIERGRDPEKTPEIVHYKI